MADFYAAAGYRNLQRRTAQAATVYPYGDVMLDELPIAMAYVPMQSLRTFYEGANALQKGTLFPELDKPFLGKDVCK